MGCPEPGHRLRAQCVRFRLRPEDRAPAGFLGNYVEFLLAGLLPWLGVQEAILRATTSVSDQAHLVKKMRFPVDLLTASAPGAALVIQAGGRADSRGLRSRGRRARPRPASSLVAFAFEVLLLAGPTFILASLNVFFRDLAQIVMPLLMIAFYLTPILYPESMVPAWATPLLASILSGTRSLFSARALSGRAVASVAQVAAEVAAFVVLGFAGRQLFRRLRPSFADLL